MSWYTTVLGWFKDRRSILISLALQILTLFVRKLAKQLWEITLEEVKIAEASGADGYKKWEMAYKGITSKLLDKNIPEWLINLAIECAVGVIQPKL